MKQIGDPYKQSVGDRTTIVWRLHVCSSCNRCVLAESMPGNSGILQESIRRIYPPLAGVECELPNSAKLYLQQALDSLAAPDGAVILAASSIDAMLKDKGYENGTLFKRIEKAHEDGLITQQLAEWAHDVRIEGNNPRHVDKQKPHASTKDAETSIAFATAIGEYLYVLPAKVRSAGGPKGIETSLTK